MKQAGKWFVRGLMVSSLAVGVALWGTGCGSDDEDTPQPQTGSKRYSVAVGIDNYAPGYAGSLATCRNDANGFSAELAKDTTLWKGDAKLQLSAGMTVLTDSQATLAALRAKLQELASTAQSGDLVVYFHSSHGGNNGATDYTTDTFLCAYDTGYEDEVLAQDLALFRDGVSIVIIIDACFSAGMFKGAPVFDFPERVMAAYADICKAKSVKGANVGWLASSEYTETSAAGPTDLDFSRFTKYLIEGFKSGDANQDGKLTFKELFDYANPLTQPAHNPQSVDNGLLSSLVAAAVDPNAPSQAPAGGW